MSDSSIRHPETGIHYRVSIPYAAALTDIRFAYERAAASRPWMSVIPQDESSRSDSEWSDPNVCFVLWHDAIGIPSPDVRRARVVEFYSEAIGDERCMLNDHKSHRDRFLARANQIDAVFMHTPRMADYMRATGVTAEVVPAGWDPFVCTEYQRRADRRPVYGYWGSEAGMRTTVVGALRRQMPDSMDDFTGMFGSALLGSLSGVSAALYIPHSEVWSFSTWRIWQSVAAGSPMVIPHNVDGGRLDCWPMEPAQCIVLPWSYGDPEWSAEQAAKDLREIMNSDRIQTARENLLDCLSDRFTIDRVIDEWLVPACAVVKGPSER